MKPIGYVVHLKTPGISGGEVRSYQIAQALATLGTDLHLYGQIDQAFDWGGLVQPHQLCWPTPLAVPQLLWDFSRYQVDIAIERYQFPPFNVGSISQLIRNRPFVLEVHGFPVDEYAFNAKNVSSSVDPLLRLFSRVPRANWERLQFRLFERAAQLIVTSAGTRAILEKLGIPRQRVSVIYNCVDPARFDPGSCSTDTSRAALGLPLTGDIILYAGSLFHEELAVVVDAASTVVKVSPSVCFLCLGSGPSNALKARARETGLSEEQFLFRTPIPHSRMPDLLAAVDVVLAPYSLTAQRFEHAFHYSPLKVMEALAMKKAVVTVDAEELHDLFGQVANMQFVESGDSESWANAILRALEMRGSPELVHGRAFVMDGYRWKDAAQKYLAILQNIEQNLR